MTRNQIRVIYNERKDYIMGDLKKSREDLQLFNKCKKKFGKEWQETVDLEKEYFNLRTKDLVKLKKWYGKVND